MDRRRFFTAAGLTAVSYRRVWGANEKIRVGLIGAGGQGQANWRGFMKNTDVTPAAVCDVYEPNLEKALSMAEGQARGFRDFRKLIELKDIDAVIVATPDHWHAIPTILACQAGKDVYVEKPLSLFIREGRVMVDTARRYNRVVQVGSQQRSGPHYAKAIEIIRSGQLGKIHHIHAAFLRNALPGWGKAPDEPPPANLDWDMWLGPAPKVPYNRLRAIYHFRWYWDYSGGQMTNFGAHDVDIARWALNARAAQAVAGFGGRFALGGPGETPDVQEVIYQFPDCVVNWSVREMNGEGRSGLTFHGTKATMFLTRRGIEILGETWRGEGAPKTPQAADAKLPGSEQHSAHIRNFLDCVKTRKRPNADVEEGHLTAVMCHLGNIATRLGRSVRWDSEKEQIVGDAEANRMCDRPYRAPWKLG